MNAANEPLHARRRRSDRSAARACGACRRCGRRVYRRRARRLCGGRRRRSRRATAAAVAANRQWYSKRKEAAPLKFCFAAQNAQSFLLHPDKLDAFYYRMAMSALLRVC